jgi:UDP-GlcNAc:undecaprenyl-phosphate GlcNAc-1-phosphate transferase
VLLITPFVFPIDRVIGSYLAASSLMLFLGIIDDLKGASWKLKLLFSAVATSIMIFGAGIWIKNLGNLLIFGDINLGLWGIPFTYIAVFGIVNAINLIDGLNGLACGVSSIAFLSFAVFASMSGNETVLYLSLANLGATLGLFKYNYPKAKIFMGDSGSLFLGFSLAILAVLLTQTEASTINPMVPVVILGIPIFDTLRVLTIRILNKKPPFAPDKTHLHHLMVRSGLPPNRVVKIIWILSALMSMTAFVLYNNEAWAMLLILCIVVASIGIFIENLKIIKANRIKR